MPELVSKIVQSLPLLHCKTQNSARPNDGLCQRWFDDRDKLVVDKALNAERAH